MSAAGASLIAVELAEHAATCRAETSGRTVGLTEEGPILQLMCRHCGWRSTAWLRVGARVVYYGEISSQDGSQPP